MKHEVISVSHHDFLLQFTIMLLEKLARIHHSSIQVLGSAFLEKNQNFKTKFIILIC